MKAKAEVDAGVCGFKALVHAVSEDGQFVTFDMSTDCDKNKAVFDDLLALGPLDAYREISPQGEGAIMGTVHARLKGCCAACAIPVAVFKSMQVAAGLALPKDISIKISKE
jgi:hypothetical protein